MDDRDPDDIIQEVTDRQRAEEAEEEWQKAKAMAAERRAAIEDFDRSFVRRRAR